MSKAFDFLLDEKNAKELVSSIPYADYIGMKIQQNINGEIRRFLEKVDMPFVNALDVYFKDTSYFAVSALGSNPVDQQINGVISPLRVDEPFIWLLYKLGYIEGSHEQ